MTKVLIIDDEIALLEQIAVMLRYEGFEVIRAARGDQGIALARAHQPDIIVSDIMLPGMDGYSVLLALQDDPMLRQIPFIFLTAKSEYAHRRRGMALGADDYLTKPFTRAELLAAIHARLGIQEAVEQAYQRKLDEMRQSLKVLLPHELRTPLTSLMGYAELLMVESEALDAAQIADMAQMIRAAGQRLQRQIENFLLYAQFDVLRSDPEQSIALAGERIENPGDLITQATQRIARRHRRSDDLQFGLVPAAIQIAPDSLVKVVEELVDNACKFSERGTPVSITTEVSNDVYMLHITDQGRGMSPEQIRNAGAYVQFERQLYEQQGVGLGLVLSRQIVSAQGGDLAIQSTPGSGTQVTVRLRLASEQRPGNLTA